MFFRKKFILCDLSPIFFAKSFKITTETLNVISVVIEMLIAELSYPYVKTLTYDLRFITIRIIFLPIPRVFHHLC